jgi:hypothetical protein
MDDNNIVVLIQVVGVMAAVAITIFLLVDGIRREALRERERNQWICENWDVARKKWKWEP